ncbi:Barwin-like endoglucanase [Glarea lozoyensis ATCC 20868]|uniref:Barwin-like endoglucanase n=2 Tax=Glarea lozoyensis TaxID=101852 RepID=S3E833_GLAL2|nr:Barwin-like endoglucanase [Glarea lozoyensis ATCC 20868]EHL00069.1 putative Allergen Asp f 7 [Glarea lozoyensis 74030]EPE34503.1 Barwin-like endoglucanase [Glarea lozoyensis ATCC 20868]
MKSAIFAAGALFATAAIAQPHGHQHQKHHVKKAEPPVVIVTMYESTTTTIGVTTTIWVTEGEAAPTPEVKPAPTTAAANPSPLDANFFEQGKQQPSSTSVSVAPTPKSDPLPPPPSATTLVTSAVASVAPVVSVPPVVNAPQAPPVNEAAPVPSPVSTTAVAPAATSAAPAANSPSSGSGAGALLGDRGGATVSGGQCTQASPCTGKSTYYDTVGTGSCGKDVDGTKVPIVAMAKGLMEQKEGANPNNNPYCNKGVTISYNGKTVNAYVFDKCPGCDGMSLDLSHAAFGALADDYLTIGHAEMSWWFN